MNNDIITKVEENLEAGNTVEVTIEPTELTTGGKVLVGFGVAGVTATVVGAVYLVKEKLVPAIKRRKALKEGIVDGEVTAEEDLDNDIED